MVNFCSDYPPAFRFTVADGTYGFLKDGSVVIVFCSMIFRQLLKPTRMTRSAYPMFYVVCPGKAEAAICLMTALFAANSFLESRFGKSLVVDFTTLDFSNSLSLACRQFFQGEGRNYSLLHCFFHLKRKFIDTTWTNKYFRGHMQSKIQLVKNDLDLIHAAVTSILAHKLYEICHEEWRAAGLIVFADHFEREYGPNSGKFQWYLAATGLPALVLTTSPLEGIWPDAKG
jgi:hypothetical protein